MARTTAYEKVHVAQQLRVRPVVADAFRDGRISYSMARVICRMDDPSRETDELVLRWAERGTVRQVEQLVAHELRSADQERPPLDPDLRRGVRRRPAGEGWAKIEVTVPELEADEFIKALDAFAAVVRRERSDDGGRSARADDGTGGGGGESRRVDDEPDAAVESRRADDGSGLDDDGDAGAGGEEDEVAWPAPVPDVADRYTRADDAKGAGGEPAGDDRRRQAFRASRADALVDLARVALAHADDGHAAGDDRYLLHLVAREGQITTLDGTPLDPGDTDMICCDASTVTHTIDDDGEPLQLGHKTKVWSTAQRRAVMVRDGGHCRFPGCERRIVDVHHRHPAGQGGPTDVDNAMAACRHHHRLLHHGFTTRRDPDATIHFHRPDGTELGDSRPAQHQLAMAA